MKNIIQFSLICVVVVSSYFFYKVYLVKEVTPTILETLSNNDEFSKKNTNNQIKNLRYEITLDENNQYTITSDFSELVNFNEYEIVKMQGVEAIFLEKKTIPILIKADNADYTIKTITQILEIMFQLSI